MDRRYGCRPCPILFILLIALFCLATGCERSEPAGAEQGLELEFDRAELMLIVATERNRYEEVYTDQIWDVVISENGTTFQDHLLDQIKLFATDIQVIVAMAGERQIQLDNSEKELIRRLAQDYYSRLTPGDKAYTGADEEDVQGLYEDYHLACKTVEALTEDAGLEISDSEAKVIHIQQIVLQDEASARKVYEQVQAEGADFALIAQANNTAGENNRKLERGAVSSRVEEAAFVLTTGEISPVIEENGRYHILKCVSDYDQEATLKRKEELSRLRKDAALREAYDAFLEEHPLSMSDEIWLGISCKTREDTSTTDLFELYKEYFPDR